jgi:hypothetical protein
MMRGPSYRGRGIVTYSVEVRTEVRDNLQALGMVARCVMRKNPDNDAVRPTPFYGPMTA